MLAVRELSVSSPIAARSFRGICDSVFVGHPKNRVREPAAEGIVVLELLEELGVVFEQRGDDALERFVVLDVGILAVGVLLGVLIGRVGGRPSSESPR